MNINLCSLQVRSVIPAPVDDEEEDDDDIDETLGERFVGRTRIKIINLVKIFLHHI